MSLFSEIFSYLGFTSLFGHRRTSEPAPGPDRTPMPHNHDYDYYDEFGVCDDGYYPDEYDPEDSFDDDF